MKTNNAKNTGPGFFTREIHLEIPLSQCVFMEREVQFPWKEHRFATPLHRLLPNLDKPALPLEIFKKFFPGALSACLHVKRLSGEINLYSAEIKGPAKKQFTTCLSRLNTLAKELQPQVEKGTLLYHNIEEQLRRRGFILEDNHIHDFMETFTRSFPPWDKAVSYNVPPDKLRFYPTGLGFLYENRLLMIDEDQLPFPYFQVPPAMKDLLTQGMVFKVHFTHFRQWDRAARQLRSGTVVREVETGMDQAGIDAFLEQMEKLERLTTSLENCIYQQTLTFEKAKEHMEQEGFEQTNFDIHQRLTRLTLQLPPARTTIRAALPLSKLSYTPGDVVFPYTGESIKDGPVKDEAIQIKPEQWPFETGPAVELHKNSFSGEVRVRMVQMDRLRWDMNTRATAADLISRETVEVNISQVHIDAFKSFRLNHLCNHINNGIKANSIDMDFTAALLKEWGLDTGHEEVGKGIAETVEPWGTENNYRILLKDIIYRQDEIEVPEEPGKSLILSTRTLRLKSSPLMDAIKEIFEGEIQLKVTREIRFLWENKENRLIISRKGPRVVFSIDDETLKRLQKIKTLYVELRETMGRVKALDFLLRGPGRSERVNLEDRELGRRGYDIECIRILEEMSEDVYLTDRDVWFRVKDRVVWERPDEKGATYVFLWPTEPLPIFIGGLWGMRLIDVQRSRDLGYIGRVIHNPDVVSRWEENLKNCLRKKPKSGA